MGVFSYGESDSSAVLTSENPTADLPAGYYLIIDTIKDADGQGHGDAVSDFVVEIVGSKTFSPKATSVPTFDKMIDDIEYPTIQGMEDGGTYETGTIIDIGEDEVLMVDNVIQSTPYTFDEPGSHLVSVKKKGGGETTITIDIQERHIHQYLETVVKPATCTEDGEKNMVCSCGDSYTEIIPAMGHSFASTSGESVKVSFRDWDTGAIGFPIKNMVQGRQNDVDGDLLWDFQGGQKQWIVVDLVLPTDSELTIETHHYLCNGNYYYDNCPLVVVTDADNFAGTIPGHSRTWQLSPEHILFVSV